MRYFLAVADAGQLTQAARRLHIAQPTLSQALAQLETQLGVHLLERHARGVHLTDAGRVFLHKARAAVAATDEAAAAASAFKRGRAGALTTGYHRMPLTSWGQMFQRLGAVHPGTRLEWTPLAFPMEGRSPIEDVDIGLILEPPDRPDLGILILEREHRVAVMAATHRLASLKELRVADLLDETWPGVHKSMDRRWRGFWSFDEERGGPAKTTDDQVTSAEEAVEVAASGLAIVTPPARMAAALAHPGLVYVPIVDAQPAAVALVWHREHANPLVDALVEIARSMTDGRTAPATTAT